MAYVLESMVRDISVRATLRKALSDDGKLSFEEVQQIVSSTYDGSGVSYREFNDIRTIMKNAKTLDPKSKQLLRGFTNKWYHDYLDNQAKKRAFTLPYNVDHIPSTTPSNRRPGLAMDPQYLTIHSTANPKSKAAGERGWLTNPSNDVTASFHLAVDEGGAVECIPLNEVAWHAGDGGSGTGNRKSIGMEICESGDRTKTLNNAISLAAKILRERGWDASKLKKHQDWSGKVCPRILISAGSRGQPSQTWEWFVDEVRKTI